MKTKNKIMISLFAPIYLLGILLIVKSYNDEKYLGLIIVLSIMIYILFTNFKFNRLTTQTGAFIDMYSEEEWENEYGCKIITTKTMYIASFALSILFPALLVVFDFTPKWVAVLICIISGIVFPVLYLIVFAVMGINVSLYNDPNEEKYNFASKSMNTDINAPKSVSIGDVVDKNSEKFLTDLKKIVAMENHEIDYNDVNVYSSAIAVSYAYQAWFLFHLGRAGNSLESREKYKNMLNNVMDKLSTKLFDISKSDFISEHYFNVFNHHMAIWVDNCSLGGEYNGPFDRKCIDAAFVWDVLRVVGFDIHDLSGVEPSEKLYLDYGILPPFKNPMILLEIKNASRIQISSLFEYIERN